MTPAILVVERARVAHRVLSYTHDPAAPAYGVEAATALGLDPRQVFKTLVVAVEGARRGAELAVAIVPVTQQLDQTTASLRAAVQPGSGRRKIPILRHRACRQ
jgi:Cys-tRNA(Pro)/Cys-tRNA(Cys) deacylase